MVSNELLTRNIAQILPSKEAFEERLKKGPIKIYWGVDPTSAEIHLGHAVVLWKLREFQDAGHKVILLIGDFTGMIGDPTDRTAARKKLTRKQVLENAKTYKEQVGKILQFSGKNPVEIKFNSQWLTKLSTQKLIELASNVTVQQMLERDFFQERIKEKRPIHLHEFLYPFMQGYDSVAMNVDAEIGGTDQTFNMLVGRALMKVLKKKEKFVITVPLLPGLDERKMSKSFGNIVAITETATDMFGMIMSLRDELIFQYFSLATKLPVAEIQSIEQQIQSNELNPVEAKKKLAWEIVKLYHGEGLADKARDEFEKVFKRGETPASAPTYKVKKGEVNLVEALMSSGMAASRSEAKRLLAQGALEWDGQKVLSETITVKDSGTLRVGKHKFLRIER